MKKLLSLLSTITITGTAPPMLIATSPPSCEMQKILNNNNLFEK